MSSTFPPRIAVIGGGPAGLRAAEVASASGAAVTLYEAKPSVGRKLLVAGRGGLNITKAEPREPFATRYLGPEDPATRWPELLADFDSDALRAWAAELGIETFAASTGRVYPREMKAAPLLRRWVERLRAQGVTFAVRHRWVGFTPGAPWQLHFQTEAGPVTAPADAAIFALGGGSWPETGSDGQWLPVFEDQGIATHPLQPANCGWELDWPTEFLAVAEGQPLKNIVVRAGTAEARGELMITRYGLEGGAIYQLGAALRALPEPVLHLDLKSTFTAEQLLTKLGGAQRNLFAIAAQNWKLTPAAVALLQITAGPSTTATSLAATAKHCRIVLRGPRPIAEAISSAGGVQWSELDENLMLRHHPGLFVAGEMIDWEAPTGGYLMQGCFATGTRAGRAALAYLQAGK